MSFAAAWRPPALRRCGQQGGARSYAYTCAYANANAFACAHAFACHAYVCGARLRMRLCLCLRYLLVSAYASAYPYACMHRLDIASTRFDVRALASSSTTPRGKTRTRNDLGRCSSQNLSLSPPLLASLRTFEASAAKPFLRRWRIFTAAARRRTKAYDWYTSGPCETSLSMCVRLHVYNNHRNN